MYAIRRQAPFFLAAVLLCLAVTALFPFCRYYIDPDATAYLTIARRYAAGDFTRAVNGYWSPLTSWLTALGIRAGIEAFTAAILVNTTGALGFLWISNRLFDRFAIMPSLLWWLNATLVVFLASAVYLQSFADLWQCFLLLSGLRIMLSERFRRSPGLWCLYGITGALAYFAKAYSFPFFILNTCCCGFFVMDAVKKENRFAWLRMCAVSITVLVIGSSPWIYLLHEKYGYWMTSTAGRLNMSWYLVGHPFYKEEITHFLPPVYPDSPYYWEDPYMANGATPRFWSSWSLFQLQWIKAAYNFLKLNNTLNTFSAFALPVWLMSLLLLISAKLRGYFPKDLRIVCLSLLLFPAGFILINFEPRYIWYTYPLTLLTGALVLQQVLSRLDKKSWKTLTVSVFTFSFICGPVWLMRPLIHEGKEEYLFARQLQHMQIKGSFASNASGRKKERRMIRLAYFSGNPYYIAPYSKNYISGEMLARELERNHISYYFYYPEQKITAPSCRLLKTDGTPYPSRQIGGITVYFTGRGSD